jgi:hypothetical protein
MLLVEFIFFNPLEPKKERERRESGGGVAIGTTFNWRGGT